MASARVVQPSAAASDPAAEAGSLTSLEHSATASHRVSLFRYAPALLLLLVVIADSGQLTDPDLWGHIRFGQSVLAHHHLVLSDPYSYSAPGHSWRNHEWLTEVLMAWVYSHLGVIGLKLWKFACVAATIFFLVLAMSETGATPATQLNTLIVAAVALMPQMEFRPQLFTFLFFAAMLAILARHNYRRSARLWLVLPIMALWGNLHGGFIIGIAALAVYTGVVGMQDLIAGKGLNCAIRLGVLTIAATIATLLTPYGIDTWYTVSHALRNPVTRMAVTDWQPLTFAMAKQWSAGHLGVAYYVCVLGLMVAMVITFVLSPRGNDLPLIAIAVTMMAAAFTAVRNMPLAVIACSLPVARHFSLLSTRLRKRDESGNARSVAMPERSGVNQRLALAVAIVLAFYGGLFSPRLATERAYPAGAVGFMQAHNLHGNVLGDFGWGEYLIWHIAPQSKVFVDGRYDTVFPLPVIRDYVLFYFDLPGAAHVLAAYPHDLVMIPPGSAAYGLMIRTAGWKLIYSDSGSALFAPTASAAAQLPGIPVTGAAPPNQYFP
jgi:hypothetical protein